LKLCSYEETGAMIAAITTSIPVNPKSQGYDFRFCWLRDSSNIIHTLNKLGSTKTMEDFLKYISNIVGSSESFIRRSNSGLTDSKDHLQPVYGIALETSLYEKEMHRLAGYRGLGPVRVGNKDYKALQHDVYGHLISASTQMFFDQRLKNMGDHLLLERLETIGERAVHVFDKPDSGPLGTDIAATEVHTFSSVMCWVAADRLCKISLHMKMNDRAEYWKGHATKIHETILEKAWNKKLQSFTKVWGGEDVDSFLLLLPSTGFVLPTDEKFTKTLDVIEKNLKLGNFIRPDNDKSDNFGNITYTFWYINALASVGKKTTSARAV